MLACVHESCMCANVPAHVCKCGTCGILCMHVGSSAILIRNTEITKNEENCLKTYDKTRAVR